MTRPTIHTLRRRQLSSLRHNILKRYNGDAWIDSTLVVSGSFKTYSRTNRRFCMFSHQHNLCLVRYQYNQFNNQIAFRYY